MGVETGVARKYFGWYTPHPRGTATGFIQLMIIIEKPVIGMKVINADLMERFFPPIQLEKLMTTS